MALLRKIKFMMFNYDWRIVEIQGATFKIVWGIVLLWPGPAFKQIAGYTSISTELYWGWGLLVLGGIHMWAISSGYRVIRRWITFLAFLFWIFSGVLVYSQSHSAILPSMYGVIAFFMSLNFLRLKPNSIISNGGIPETKIK